MRVNILLICIFFLLIITGCSSWNIEDVKPVVDNFYKYTNTNDYGNLKSMLHEKWFEATSEEKTTQLFKTLNSKFGTVKEYELIDWQVKSIVGTNGGTYFSLKYTTKRTIKDTTDTFTLFKPSGLDIFYILGYNAYADISEE